MQPASMCYVSIAGEDRIATLRLQPGQDSLELIEQTDARGMPGPMYTGLRSAHQVAVYHADPACGTLTLLDTVSLPDEPC